MQQTDTSMATRNNNCAATIIRCTVSGGLEDLAEKEVHQNLKSLTKEIKWAQRGKSGSQLEIRVDVDDPLHQKVVEDVLVDKIMHLRLVEYVYLVVYSKCFKLDCLVNDETAAEKTQVLLNQMKESVATELNDTTAALYQSLVVGAQCQKLLCDKSVGLEKLPGKLLPTPGLQQFKEEEEEEEQLDMKHSQRKANSCKDTATETTVNPHPPRSFLVNTIYTKPHVAEMISQSFVSLVHEHYDNKYNNNNKENFLWLDAGAGSGELLHHLPNPKIGIDIHPAASHIHPIDFFHLDKQWLEFATAQQQQQQQKQQTPPILCILSNPPFAQGTRGDYTPIIQFINHSIQKLNAKYIGLIVPCKFARERIWSSLGMDLRARLVARFFLPHSSFYDPSKEEEGDDGKRRNVHIHCYFLFFEIQTKEEVSLLHMENSTCDTNVRMEKLTKDEEEESRKQKHTVHITVKRDKGDFPDVSSASFKESIVSGLAQAGVHLASESAANYTILSKLYKSDKFANGESGDRANLELLLLLNPEKPLSLAHCVSQHVSNHSLGWISTSAKPPVAHAMCFLAMNATKHDCINNKESKSCSLVINTMSGEGTIELESQDDKQQQQRLPHPFFVISGDKSKNAVAKTAVRLVELGRKRKKRPLVDMVIWDAQNLPLRSDIADVVLMDLPIAGSTKKNHQVPFCSSSEQAPKKNTTTTTTTTTKLSSTLSYRSVMSQAMQVMRSGGTAALLSTDTKALGHAIGGFHWSTVTKISGVNLGGLNAQLSLMKKQEPSTKDLSMWVMSSDLDLCEDLLQSANKATFRFYLDDKLELQQRDDSGQQDYRYFDKQRHISKTLVVDVKLHDTFYHKKKGMFSQCYRFSFHGLVTNLQAKILEKHIRGTIVNKLPGGVIELR